VLANAYDLCLPTPVFHTVWPQVPTLVMAGEFDTMSEECHQLCVDSIPTAWPLVTIPRAAHCKLLDEPQLCCAAMYKFVFTCESTRMMP
jgi:pimeloyl-ACP methyl ester carboxylesterase